MNRKSILIDLDRLKNLNTGLGQVAEFFGTEIGRTDDDRFHFTLLVPKNFVGRFGDNVDYEVVSLKRRYFPSLCRKYDLWYTIHQDSAYFPSDRKTPYVLTINDLNFLGEKTAAKAAKRLRILQKKVDRASVITVISKFTEGVVREHLNVGAKPVQVIYCGVKVKTFEGANQPAFAPEGDLLFSVGVVQMKKNYHVLIDFMKRLPENYKLIIAGNKSGPYAPSLQQKIDEAGLHDRILLPGIISEEDKYWMYTHCKAVLFPSKFEGMGFPPVEAMRFGKPVFASTYSSIPEVSEHYAYYWKSFDPDEMAEFFLTHLKMYEADTTLPEQLRQHSMKYTWENNLRLYLELFGNMLGV
ncbi:MAG: glycosyltransferase family 4 protein [Marinilabiliales bacterium]|nr:glycosyltransferase family 4 protein [Marinilabiliales bacterium]